jgi:hypothetical protein
MMSVSNDASKFNFFFDIVMQESDLLGENRGLCSASTYTQRGQYSPLSPILTAQLLCTMLEMSSSTDPERPGSPTDPYGGKLTWKGLNIGQMLELVLGDSDRNQVWCHSNDSTEYSSYFGLRDEARDYKALK